MPRDSRRGSGGRALAPDELDARSAAARADRARGLRLRDARAHAAPRAARPCPAGGSCSSGSGSRCCSSRSRRRSPRSASRSSSASTCSSTSCIGDLAPLCLLAGLTGPLLRPLLAFRVVERLRVLANPFGRAAALGGEPLLLAHAAALRGGGRALGRSTRSSTRASSRRGLIMWLPVLETLPAPEWFGTGAKLGYIAVVRRRRDRARQRLRLVGHRLLRRLRTGRGAVGGVAAQRPGARRER